MRFQDVTILWSLDDNVAELSNKEDEEKPIPNRYLIKKQAQIMVDSKSKKKGVKSQRGTMQRI